MSVLQLNDATFSKFTSTNVCAPYADSHRWAPNSLQPFVVQLGQS